MYISSAAIVFIGITYLYILFCGNPWNKIIVRKEVSAYLKEKYGHDFEVAKVHYSFDGNPPGHSGYSAWAYLVGEKDMENRGINVETPNIRNRNTYYDSYLHMLWRNELDDQLNPVVAEIYQNNDIVRAKVGIFSTPPSIKGFNYRNHKMPKYEDVKDELDKINLTIYIDRQFNHDEKDDEYRKMFSVISYIKEKQYKFTEIEFIFGLGILKYSDIVYYKIPYDELIYITDYKQIAKYED